MLKKGARPGARGEQVEVPARQQVVLDQGAGGLVVDQDLVAHLQVLQLRGERAVRHLDREELELVLVIGAGHGIGAQQRAALDLEPDHGELAVEEAERRVPGRLEAEQGIGPVMDAQHLFGHEIAHRDWAPPPREGLMPWG
jgi:hypothetical protein